MALGKGFSGVRGGNSPAGLIDVDIIPLPIILVGQFGELAAGVRSFHEPLKRSIQEVVIPSIKTNFDYNGRPPWAPLSGTTWAMRGETSIDSEGNQIINQEGDILVRTGKLKRSAVALARWKITRDEAYAGGDWPATAWYGPIQQTGFVGGHGAETPARPFMLIQDEDVPKIEEVFVDWFKSRLAMSGFIPGNSL
jgi:phage gpG-like protein